MDSQILDGLYSRRKVLETKIEELYTTIMTNQKTIQELTQQNQSCQEMKDSRESKLTLLNQQIQALENTLKSLSANWLSSGDDDEDDIHMTSAPVPVVAPVVVPVVAPVVAPVVVPVVSPVVEAVEELVPAPVAVVPVAKKEKASKASKAASAVVNLTPFEQVVDGETYMVDPKTNQVTITDEEGIAEVGTWDPVKKEIVFFTEDDE
jgi:hypothetical protein